MKISFLTPIALLDATRASRKILPSAMIARATEPLGTTSVQPNRPAPACLSLRLQLWLARALAAATLLVAAEATARGLIPRGLYEIIVAQEGSGAAGEPLKIKDCLTKTRIRDVSAFHVRTDHPLRQCPISDVRFNGEELLFRIVCSEGPNAPSAKAKFVHTQSGYDGTITIDTGSQKKKIIEHHRAHRIGECPGDGTDSSVQVDEMHWRSEPLKAVPNPQ